MGLAELVYVFASEARGSLNMLLMLACVFSMVVAWANMDFCNLIRCGATMSLINDSLRVSTGGLLFVALSASTFCLHDCWSWPHPFCLVT